MTFDEAVEHLRVLADCHVDSTGYTDGSDEMQVWVDVSAGEVDVDRFSRSLLNLATAASVVVAVIGKAPWWEPQQRAIVKGVDGQYGWA